MGLTKCLIPSEVPGLGLFLYLQMRGWLKVLRDQVNKPIVFFPSLLISWVINARQGLVLCFISVTIADLEMIVITFR